MFSYRSLNLVDYLTSPLPIIQYTITRKLKKRQTNKKAEKKGNAEMGRGLPFDTQVQKDINLDRNRKQEDAVSDHAVYLFISFLEL